MHLDHWHQLKNNVNDFGQILTKRWDNKHGPRRLGADVGAGCGRCEGGVLIINWKLSSVAGSLGI